MSREELIGNGRYRPSCNNDAGLLHSHLSKTEQHISLSIVPDLERATFQKKTIILCSPTSEDMRLCLNEGDKNKSYKMFFPPLGLTLVGQHLVNAGYDVKFFDGNFTGIYKENMIEEIINKQDTIAYVGFYLSILQIKDFLELAKKIRKTNFDIPIVAGGPFPQVFPKKIMESDLIDISCIGDGAEPSVLVADHYNNKCELKDIPNICFKENDNLIIKHRTHRDTLNNENFIRYDNFINIKDYSERFNCYLTRDYDSSINQAVPILTGLGCSYKCSFCENALLGHKHFSMSADHIVDQIVYYKENHDVDTFAFFDEDFFYDKNRLFRLIELMENLPFRIKWGTQSRCNYFRESYINSNVISKLENIGLARVCIGVESGSPRMLKKIRKGITREMVLKAARISSDSPIIFTYSFIVHIPGETLEDFQLTYDLIDKLEKTKKNSHVSAVHTYFAYPGTPLSVELENELGFKIENKVSFEDFAKYDLNEYNKIINPIKRDAVKDCIFYHYFHRNPEIGMGDGISTSFLRNKVDTGWRFGKFALGVFRLIGNVRRRYNFYKLPIEIYVFYLAKWLGKIVRKFLYYLHIKKSWRSKFKNYSGLVELEPTRT